MSLSLTLDLLKKYKNDNFFETGTYDGGGVSLALQARYKNIYSVEIYEPYQINNISKFKNNRNVHLYTGDSELLLPEIIAGIDNEITFFLDSHTIYQTGELKGLHDVPLIQELLSIKEHPIKTHTIMIDDRCMMGNTYAKGGWKTGGWVGFSEQDVLDILKEINPEYNIAFEDSKDVCKDIIVAYI